MSERNESSAVCSWASVCVVSLYLLFVGMWLVVTRQIPAPGLKKIINTSLRRRYQGDLLDYQPETGNCWVVEVPEFLPSDKEAASSLRLFENGRELGPGHASHDEVRRSGCGRYSHWGAALYFSTSDNSDPRANGRRYTVSEAR